MIFNITIKLKLYTGYIVIRYISVLTEGVKKMFSINFRYYRKLRALNLIKRGFGVYEYSCTFFKY